MNENELELIKNYLNEYPNVSDGELNTILQEMLINGIINTSIDLTTLNALINNIKNIINKENNVLTLDYLSLNDMIDTFKNMTVLELQRLFDYLTNGGEFEDLDFVLQDYINDLNADELNELYLLITKLIDTPLGLSPTNISNADSVLHTLEKFNKLTLKDLNDDIAIEYLKTAGADEELKLLFEEKGTDFIKNLLLMSPTHKQITLYNYLNSEFSTAVSYCNTYLRYGSEMPDYAPVASLNFNSTTEIIKAIIQIQDITNIEANGFLYKGSKNIDFTDSNGKGILTLNNQEIVLKELSDEFGNIINFTNVEGNIYKVQITLYDKKNQIFNNYTTNYKSTYSIKSNFSLQNEKTLFSDIYDKVNKKLFHKFKPEFIFSEILDKITITTRCVSKPLQQLVEMTFSRTNEVDAYRIKNNYLKIDFNRLYDMVGKNLSDVNGPHSGESYPITEFTYTAYDINNNIIETKTMLCKQTTRNYDANTYSNEYNDTTQNSYNQYYYKCIPEKLQSLIDLRAKTDNIQVLWESNICNIDSVSLKTVVSKELTNNINITNLQFDFNLTILPKVDTILRIYSLDADNNIIPGHLYELNIKKLRENNFGINQVMHSTKLLLTDLTDEVKRFKVTLEKEEIILQYCNIEYTFIHSDNITSTVKNENEKLTPYELYDNSIITAFCITGYNYQTIPYSNKEVLLNLNVQTKEKGSIYSRRIYLKIYSHVNMLHGDKVYEEFRDSVVVGDNTFTFNEIKLDSNKKYYVSLEAYHPHDSGVLSNGTVFELIPMDFKLGDYQLIMNDVDNTEGFVILKTNLDEFYNKNINTINKIKNPEVNLEVGESIDKFSYGIDVAPISNLINLPHLLINMEKSANAGQDVKIFDIGVKDGSYNSIYPSDFPIGTKFDPNIFYSTFNMIYRDSEIEDSVNTDPSTSADLTSKNSVEISLDFDSNTLLYNKLNIFNSLYNNANVSFEFEVSRTVNNVIEYTQQGSLNKLVIPGVSSYNISDMIEFEEPFNSYCFKIVGVLQNNTNIHINTDIRYNNFIGNGKNRTSTCGQVFHRSVENFFIQEPLKLSGKTDIHGLKLFNIILDNNIGEPVTIVTKIATSYNDDIGVEITGEVEIELNELNQNEIQIKAISNSFRKYIDSVAFKITSIIGKSGMDYFPSFSENYPTGIISLKLTDFSTDLNDETIFY